MAEVSSVVALVVLVKATVGAASSSVMVAVCVVLAPRVALLGADSVKMTVSLPSKMVSCSTGIFTVWLVTPALKVTVTGEPMAV